jgi:hypothetical protein
VTTIAFDTLKFVEKLEAGGFTHAQAKAAAEAFAEATAQELATKTDIAVVRADIRELELRITIKLGGLMMAATGLVLAANKFMK